ncbi:hypothetical protein AB0C52_00445 [Streptomyces sp. NPDC048717]|uniref:hypothetical protein n=1 Tax=Streptomyces sp. NPDC048717 TaxID=3154928 RepID=UPI003412DD4D
MRGRVGGVRGAGRRAAAYPLALLLAAGTLVLGDQGAGSAKAVSGCQGRPTRVIGFATGELRLYRTRSYVCALAVAKRPGAPRPMSVSLQARGGRAVVDKGRFARQAGPVTIHALNRCVRASATLDGRSKATGWILC